MKLNKIFHLLTLACALTFSACSDDDTDFGENGILLGTPQITEVTAPTAKALATVAKAEETRVMSYGFCYAVSDAPTIHDATVTGIPRNGLLEIELNNLTNEKVYRVRTFAVLYQGGVVYSDVTEMIVGQSATEVPSEELEQYTAPTYADDYTSIADWANRSRWNLANVHDPSIMKAADGYYYMYQTDASYGNAHEGHGHFHARRSKDLVNWEYLGGTMNEAPGWIKEKLNEYRSATGLSPIDNPQYAYWAPVARKVNDNKYRMYYSIVVSNPIDGKDTWTERSFIGLAETSDPASNQWEDKGFVICSSSDKGLDWANTGWESAYFKWNAIDPSYIITPEGKHWLVYGSWHSGIAALQIDAETGKPAETLPAPWGTAEDIAPYGKLLVSRNLKSRWQSSEGPEIIYNAQTGYYYLFLAYDALDIPYNTRVCRSKNIDGPYEGIDGTNLTANGGDMYPVVTHPYKFSQGHGWVGLSHCAVFEDGNGNWYYSSQGRLPENIPDINASNAVMMGHIRSIRWTSDRWPVVMPERYGAVPQVPITESELAGKWENIDLSYQYGQQKIAETLTLGADHKVTAGIWEGSTWNYDASRQVLTINGIELYLQRETDWEATPRTHTIVYAGYNGTNTYWGKKSK